MNASMVILPIGLEPGLESELLLEEVSTFVFSLENRQLYIHILKDNGNTFVVKTNANVFYVFVRMLHVVEVYEDGPYIHMDFDHLKQFLESYQQLDVPLNGSELALAEFDPYDPPTEKMQFCKGFINAKVIEFVETDELDEFVELLDRYNIQTYQSVNEIFN